VCLQLDGRAIVGRVKRLANVDGLAVELEVILHEDAVEEDGDVRGRFQGAVGVEAGRGPDDVVGLPLTGLAGGVYERGRLLVDAARLTVNVGGVFVRVEDLELVAVVAGAGGGEEDAAVATGLAAAGDVGGDLKFEVELVVLETLLRLDVAVPFVHGENAIVDKPAGWLVRLGGDPRILILSAEENDGIGGRVGIGRAGPDDFRDGLPDLGLLGSHFGGLLSEGGDGEEQSGNEEVCAHDGKRITRDWPSWELTARAIALRARLIPGCCQESDKDGARHESGRILFLFSHISRARRCETCGL